VSKLCANPIYSYLFAASSFNPPFYRWKLRENFGLPIGINGFSAQWSPFVDKQHALLQFSPPLDFLSPEVLV